MHLYYVPKILYHKNEGIVNSYLIGSYNSVSLSVRPVSFLSCTPNYFFSAVFDLSYFINFNDRLLPVPSYPFIVLHINTK